MEINKSCETCQFYIGDNICIEEGYKKDIPEIHTEKNCWEISMYEYLKLCEKLDTEEEYYLLDVFPAKVKRQKYKQLSVKNDVEFVIKCIQSK